MCLFRTRNNLNGNTGTIAITLFFIDFRERERGRSGERERERNIDLLFHSYKNRLILGCALTRDRTCNVAGQHDTLTNRATRPGPDCNMSRFTRVSDGLKGVVFLLIL